MSGILAATLRWVLKPQALQVKLEDLWIVVDVGIPGRRRPRSWPWRRRCRGFRLHQVEGIVGSQAISDWVSVMAASPQPSGSATGLR